MKRKRLATTFQVSRNGAEPAFSLHNHCPCRVLCRVHTRLTTAPRIDASCTSTATCKSLCRLKLPVLSYILLKRKFIRQASRQCQRALDPHTDWLIVCLWLGLVTSKMLLWFGLQKLPPFNSHVVSQKRSSPLQNSRKRLWIFFSLNQPLPAVWALETWWQHSAMSAGAG